MMQRRIISGKNTDQRTELYVLKHKDKEIAIVQMDVCTGRLKRAAEVLLPEELPAGCGADGSRLPEWWENRAIPDSRIGLQHVLAGAGMQTNLSLMLSSYGLSLTDHYWMQPAERKLYWKDLNFYENIFSDVLGNLLTDTEETGRKNALPGNLSPSFSVNGDMKKKWVIREGARCLLKVTSEYYGQQSVNELIAVRLHERLSWDHYVPYRIEYRKIRGTEYPCSLSPLFTSEEREFVSAYQLLLDYKIPNESSLYEALVSRAVQSGMEEERVRRQLEYTIMTDFILSNTDRHLNNMGFLYDSKRRFFCGMAPVFDTGNSLLYDREESLAKTNLLGLKVNSFCRWERDLLRYVKNSSMLNLEKLKDFPEEAESLLLKYTEMPVKRAGEIAGTIRGKIRYLTLFQQGKRVWKQGKYW